MRRALVLFVFVLALALNGQASAAWTKTDQRLVMDDGAEIATSYYRPVAEPPVGGYPAIVMFHGIGQTREPLNRIAEQLFADDGYAVLTFDFRGHGASGGLFSLDGPRELEDTRALLRWLQGRPEVDDAHIGAWGLSLGGGMVLRSLEAGLPFAAAEVYQTWVDLYEALVPNRLSKSGAIFQFLSSVGDRVGPEITAIRSAALTSTNLGALRTLADSRSTVDALPSIRVPVHVFQGRRDFVFDLRQGITAYRRLGGPKALYIGDFGHAPSTFPGPDAQAMFHNAIEWFGRYLKAMPLQAAPIELAPDPWTQETYGLTTLPATTTVKTAKVKVARTFARPGSKVVKLIALPNRKLELFGAPVVTLTASTRTQATQVVAVLEAVPPSGNAILVSEGGTKVALGRKPRTLSFPLISDTALIPRGSKLRLTLSWTSTAQSPSNLLYLTGVPDGSSCTIANVRVTLPVLRRPVSR